ncbi:phosphopentomutase [Pseudoteredinibacter isoporae]|uniref:Phosphopentomutase n=1 Tax=Pseudoteredinibacter isoporae TaxID=570281 RepID=A0A7X0MYL0_9GAMM|nr:phosphopentomutase [Pseudoteredinibacter isoporae]MBB6523204.1 phosphopentomutase [Pseudoteredinibacter isoporae]NHO88722.1 phosphopentomutase [Pseudoteredinibacter isoporae]NIB22587.1 phosphopentomutase [Pseudoteredinibacter isoporae]
MANESSVNFSSNIESSAKGRLGRAILLVLDSFGVGASEDAESFGDAGSNTLGHIAQYCAEGRCENGRSGPLHLPNLKQLGLFNAAQASDASIPALNALVENDTSTLIGRYGFAKELSTGKDTSSGHWEMSGVPVFFDWSYFSDKTNSFPKELLQAIIEAGDLSGVLANCHASGTEIIARLGEEHMATGKPIIYTSADSVVQIAAHEESFGLDRLLALCEKTRAILDQMPGLNVGRVIARPFVGSCADNFTRTGNRRDYSVPPPEATLLDKLIAAQGNVFSVGKIADIFAQQGISQRYKANGIEALFEQTIKALNDAGDKTLVFTNFVDFDSSYGHRRDVNGYAQALEAFDAMLPRLMDSMSENDILLISADHGCDPSWPGTDHTREHVPVLAYGKTLAAENVGKRNSFADIGQSLAGYFGLEALPYGESFLVS